MLVSACTTIPTSIEREPAAGPPTGQPHWWVVRFGMGYETLAKVKRHLDALFGYQPVLIHERRLMRF